MERDTNLKPYKSIYEMAANLSEVRTNINNHRPELILELSKLFLFSFDKTNLNHWKQKVFNHLEEMKFLPKKGSSVDLKFYKKHLHEIRQDDLDYYENLVDRLKQKKYSKKFESSNYDSTKEKSLHEEVQSILLSFCEELAKKEKLDRNVIYSIIDLRNW